MSYESVRVTDATGKNYGAKTTDTGQLVVQARQSARDANALGNAYSVVTEIDSNAADGDFFYMRNTNAVMDLVIHKIRIQTGSVDTPVDIKVGCTGTPTSGTAIIPTTLKCGSGKQADVDCQYRIADMALTGGFVVDTLYVDKDFVGTQAFEWPAGIIVPPNTAMLLNSSADPTADIEIVLFFHFRPAE